MTGVVTAVELPAFALAELIASAGVGEPHPVLRPEPVWRSPAERAELAGAAVDALARAGVLRADVQVDQWLLDLLPVLTTPVREYYGWFSVDGSVTGVLAAAGAQDAVLVVCAGEWVRLSRTGPDLLDALVGELPSVAPGRGDQIVVSTADITELLAPADVSERVVPANVTGLLRHLRQPVRDGGELYAASRDPLGRQTTYGPVRYADTERGRYLNYAVGADLVVAPATPAALAAALARATPYTPY